MFNRHLGQLADDPVEPLGACRFSPETVLMIQPIVTGKTGRMTKQVAVSDRLGQRHRLTTGCLNPHLGQFRQGIRHGIVQFEFASLVQNHRRHAGDRLGHRPDRKHRFVVDCPVVRHPRDRGPVIDDLSAANDEADVGRRLLIRNQFFLGSKNSVQFLGIKPQLGWILHRGKPHRLAKLSRSQLA